MGGLSSGTTASTRRIYVESASFDPITIRKTSQRLGIRTDSSLRFEKGVDTILPHLAQSRYSELLTHYVDGVTTGLQSVTTNSAKPTTIEVSDDMLQRKIGKGVSEKEVTDILTRL